MDNKFITGTPEWHELRRQSIGASDCAVILGISPWKTPYQLWCEKLGYSDEKESSYAMRRGLALEGEAISLYERVMGQQFFPQVVFHPKYKFIMASLDGMNLIGTAAVEVKCPGETTHMMAVNGEVPPHYMAQLQHQMMCAELSLIDYYSYDGDEGVRITVPRDDDYITTLLEKELEFWGLVTSKTPPPLTEKDYKLKDEDPEWFARAKRLVQIDEQLASLEDERDYLKAELIEQSNGYSCKGCGIMLTRSIRKGNINYKKIEQLKGVDLEPYRNNSCEVWTLRIS